MTELTSYFDIALTPKPLKLGGLSLYRNIVNIGKERAAVKGGASTGKNLAARVYTNAVCI